MSVERFEVGKTYQLLGVDMITVEWTPVTLGCAYSASDVLPIKAERDLAFYTGSCIVWTDVPGRLGWWLYDNVESDDEAPPVCIDLAHYGDPAGLVGKWALQLAVT